MKIGIGLPNQVRGVDPTIISTWASRAEQAGFSALGTVGRIAYPGVTDTVALAAAAGATHSIELVSGVLLAPVWPAGLLAKEVAGIDAVSGGRLTLGIGIGSRPDDFVADEYGLGTAGRGKRFDRDLEAYRRFWRGENVGGGPNPGVTQNAREVPLVFGGMAPASYRRAAEWGEGYVGASLPAEMVAPAFEATRAAWAEAGREGEPRLIAIGYVAVKDGDLGRSNIHDYYSISGEQIAGLISGNVSVGADAIKAKVESFAELGATDLILNPGVADLDEIARIAEIVL